MSPQGDPARDDRPVSTDESMRNACRNCGQYHDEYCAYESLLYWAHKGLASSSVEAQLRQQRDGLVTALRNICDDACGERRDPLWIVKRELIYAGSVALAGVETPPQETK